jgi:CheY-like chemotaxis protein
VNFNDPQAPLLVVDDNEDDIFLLRRTLTAAGCRQHVLVFEDGEDVVVYLKGICAMAAGGAAKIPLLMFCDIRMPRLGGFEVLEWVRAQPVLTSLQVVMLSSSDLPEDVQHATQLGAHSFITKHPTAIAVGALLDELAMPRIPAHRAS